MIKKKLMVFLISILLLFSSNTVEAAAHDQHCSVNGKGKVGLSHINKDKPKGIKPELETGEDGKEGDIGLSSEEIELLARLVHAEAKGEPFLGKVGVAATVLNRLENAQYPDTVREIIYQQNYGFQYCPVRNGQINQPADQVSFWAVRKAMEGKDPTGGALSFYNPSKSGNSWIRARIYCKQIGNHIFVK